MIRVVVSYPSQPGSRFDMDDYLNRHMALVEEKLGPYGMTSAGVDLGLAGGAPDSPPRFQVQAFLNFPTLEQMERAMAAEGPALMADVPNFTDIQPELQINEILR